MTDTLSLEAQTAYIRGRFSMLFPTYPRVDFDDERICVSFGPQPDEVTDFWLMEIGSDDDRYRFELWENGRDTGIYVEFAFEGETL